MRLRNLAAWALVPALVLTGAAVPVAHAADPDRPVEADPGSSRAAEPADVAVAETGGAIVTDRREQPVAPGVRLVSTDSLDARGWLRTDLLVADLDGGTTIDYLNPGTVSGRAPLSEQAAGRRAIAGVNGDFFDINDTGAPLGVGIQRDADGGAGAFVNGPAGGHNDSFTLGADGLARLAQVFLEGTVDDGEAPVTLTNLNSPTVATDGVGLYTPAWGDVDLARTVDGVPAVRQVLVADGVVTATSTTPTPLPGDGVQALVGQGAGAEALAGLEVGEEVTIDYGPRSDAGEIAVAISGNRMLARDGEVLPVDDTALHPRTAVGISEDGRRIWLLTVDGRQSFSRGLTEVELGQAMLDLGADDVLNLDGGGSSTMLAREPGAAGPEVVNSPSDGGERITPNGLGFLAPAGTGRLTGFHVETAVGAGPDAGSRADSLRVLAGLRRVVRAAGHDETWAPVEATPRWRVTGRSARVAASPDPATAVVTGLRPGAATVRATRGGAGGSVDLQVLGEPRRISASTSLVPLADDSATGRFRIDGFDEDGFGTWVEPHDVRLSFDPAVVGVVPDGDGFVVTPRVETGSTVVRVRVGDLETSVAVTVGLTRQVVDPVDDPAAWQATGFPAVVTATRSEAPGHEGGTAIALDYSLTGTTATRAAYLAATPDLALPGAPQRIGAWVEGDGQGAWLRLNVYDAAGGAAKTIDLAPRVDWTGWRYVEATVPPGLVMPLSFFRLYVVETDPARQYSGRIAVDDLTVSLAPEVDLPPVQRVADPLVVTDGTVEERGRWRFAVLSDAQFTADDPDSDVVAQARRTIREALAADPDFLVVNGDFVDRGFPDDIALAKRVLDEEVGGRVPVHYVPGNHEAAGPGDLAAWSEVFGPPSGSFDHRGTRFVLLDSSRGSLRAGGFDQLLMLRDRLAEAEADRSVRSVVVLAHHPIDDPAATDNSQLGDRLEADLVVDWLADLRARSGDQVAYVASHAGTFHASREDGVLLPITGNSGKGPSSAPGDGGFTGWALVGVDPTPRAERGRRGGGQDWLRVEMRPHVDTLELIAPETLPVFGVGSVRATVLQGADRRVPVAWPVSADWTGSDNLAFSGGKVDRRDVAVLNPVTGRLTGIRAGRVSVAVTVNGVTERRVIRVG